MGLVSDTLDAKVNYCYLFVYLFIQYFTSRRVTHLATLAILPRGPLKTYIHIYIQYEIKQKRKRNIKFTLST